MTLFQAGDFVLASGARSSWKIECDALTRDDWEALAAIAAERLPPFGAVEGVPRGGLLFAEALRKYSRSCSVSYPHPAHDWCDGTPLPILIAEDVVTTGGSMERFRAKLNLSGQSVVGVAAFARGTCPEWVIPLFRLTAAVGSEKK